MPEPNLSSTWLTVGQPNCERDQQAPALAQQIEPGCHQFGRTRIDKNRVEGLICEGRLGRAADRHVRVAGEIPLGAFSEAKVHLERDDRPPWGHYMRNNGCVIANAATDV